MKRIALSVITTAIISVSSAQGPTDILDSIHSVILGENRTFDIVLPDNYDSSKYDTYEVVYALDGLNNFLKLESAFLQGEGFIPKTVILVGVNNTFANGNNMRDRDFTPTKTSNISGGAPQFLRFFKEELLPYITRKYHTKFTAHTLYGGSLGGLFAMYVFLEDPSLFTSYIAIDPSLWWDGFYLNKLAAEKLQGRQLNNTLWIGGRTGTAYHYMGVAGMDTVLQKKAPRGLQWKVSLYENDTHYSSNFKGFYEGLKFSYGGFYASTGGYPASQNIAIKPHYGIALKNQPFSLYCFNLLAGKYIHYTIDGTEPTISSPLLSGEETPIRLTHNAKIIFKSFCARSEYDKIDSAFFTIDITPFPVELPAGAHSGGLRLTLNGTNVTADGFIKIPADNYYIFEMGQGNDSTKVWLANEQILGIHYKDGSDIFMVPLKKGYYPLKISYIEKEGYYREPLYLKPQGVDDFVIPPAMLYGTQQ